MSTYEEKRTARIERLQRAAERKSVEATAAIEKANKMASVIPFGQPIHIGHHSEGRDRRYRARIDATYTKGFAAMNEAKDAARRAEAAATSTAISSDDPEALAKLQAELATLETNQALMTDANKAIRAAKGDNEKAHAALVALGFPEARAAQLLAGKTRWDIGFPSFKLTNNAANIRRIKGRIAELAARPTEANAPAPHVNGDVSATWNAEANRVQVRFPGKPDDATRARLRASGFLWAPSAGAWQRKATDGAWYAAKAIVGTA